MSLLDFTKLADYLSLFLLKKDYQNKNVSHYKTAKKI